MLLMKFKEWQATLIASLKILSCVGWNLAKSYAGGCKMGFAFAFSYTRFSNRPSSELSSIIHRHVPCICVL